MTQVSVVIPVYNIAAHLRQCLDSVLGQTLRDIEVICVDDGSTDESPAILAEYARRDPRIQVLTQANTGPGGARNLGMARVAGQYLIFLDSDDWFEPDFLACMAARAGETGADVTVCRSVSFDSATGRELPSGWMLGTGALPGAVFHPDQAAGQLFQFTHGWPWDKLYRTGFVREHGFRFPDLRNSQDLVFVYPSLLRAEKIAVLEQILIHHRFHRKASVSNRRIEDQTAPYQAARMLKDYMDAHRLTETYERSFLNWVAGFLVWHIGSVGGYAAQRELLGRLRREWFPALGVSARPLSCFSGGQTKAKLLLARYAPAWLFFAVFAGYNGAKERGLR